MDRLAPELRADPNLLAHVATVAALVLRRHGDDPDAEARTEGWVNPGWMSERFVVRVGLVPGQTDLRREAMVAAALPTAVGYPQVVDAGVLAGHEYLLTRRIPGTSLLHAWPTLSWKERSDAIKQVWALAEQVHAIDLSDLSGVELTSSPFYAASLEDAVESLEMLRTARLLSRGQIDSLTAQLHDFFESVSSEPSVLNHGDLYIGNAMWDGTDVVGLLDFEFAVVAPVEVDLNEIVKHAFAPADTIGDDTSLASRPLRQAVVDIVAHRRVRPAMLKGYSILLELWLTNREIGRRRLEEIRVQQSYRLLTALVEREGGYFAPLLSR